ncbi:MAG: hypothetical protein VCE91_06275 [Nitrospinota bacterium]
MTGEMDGVEFFFEKKWSDGLPVVVPTEERIERMISGASRDPVELIGAVPPAFGEATVRAIAAHAVMAGCRPEYLPVLIAGLESMLDERFGLNGLQGSMNSSAPLLIVNGPYAKKIGLHGGRGCFGPGFRANATIGRAIRLMLLNLGGGIPGVVSMSTFGQPSKYTFCIAENEAGSPWDPFSVSRGLEAGEDAVTAVACENPQLVVDNYARNPEQLFVSIADTMSHLGCWNQWVRSDLVLALSPQQAAICADLSREDVRRRLCDLAGRRLGDLKRAGQYRPEWMQDLPFEVDLEDDDFFVPVIKDPADLHIIVAGGSPGPHCAVMHGWNGGSRAVSRAFTV